MSTKKSLTILVLIFIVKRLVLTLCSFKLETPEQMAFALEVIRRYLQDTRQSSTLLTNESSWTQNKQAGRRFLGRECGVNLDLIRAGNKGKAMRCFFW